MRVVIRIENGSQAGRKITLATGQWLRFGRTNVADVVIPEDGQMSGLHFQLSSEQGQCHLKDFDSTNGTFVNGNRLQEAWLQPGDEITSGSTRFTVLSEESTTGTSPAIQESATDRSKSQSPFDVTKIVGIVYESRFCDSEVHCYTGNTQKVPAAELAEHLGKQFSMSVVVNMKSLPAETQPELTEPQYLMDWIPDESQRKYSPVVLNKEDGVCLQNLIADGWGKDAIVVLYRNPEADFPLQEIRNAAGPFSHPSILRPILNVGAPAFVGNLLSGLAAIFIEGESSDHWLLFSAKEIDGQLAQLGFERQNSPVDNDVSKANVREEG
jgi:pSer/pThr/pTyr-binding forkhead associated (FHA) protein